MNLNVSTSKLIFLVKQFDQIQRQIDSHISQLDSIRKEMNKGEYRELDKTIDIIISQIKEDKNCVANLEIYLERIQKIYYKTENKIVQNGNLLEKNSSNNQVGDNGSASPSDMTYKEFLQYRIDNAADINTRKMYEKYLKKIRIKDDSYSDTAHYDNIWNHIKYDEGDDATNVRGIGCTYFHEVGHLVDDQSDWFGSTSTDGSYEFYNKLESDVENYVNNIMEEKGYQNRDDAYDDFSKWLKTDGNMKNGISDLAKGITEGKSCGGWSHSDDYYTEKSIEKEAFAHFFEAGMAADSTKLDYIKEVFPEAYEEYQQMLKEELD